MKERNVKKEVKNEGVVVLTLEFLLSVVRFVFLCVDLNVFSW